MAATPNKEEQVSFRLDSDVKREFDIKLAGSGESATNVLRDAVRAYLGSEATAKLAPKTVSAPRETELIQKIADLLADPKNELGKGLKLILPRIVRDK